MELIYHRKGEYLFPNLVLQEKAVAIGKYGMLRKTYLKQNKKNWYQSMMLTGKLDNHLVAVEEAAEKRMTMLMKELTDFKCAVCLNETKIAWVAHMNNLTAMAEECVLTELVYN